MQTFEKDFFTSHFWCIFLSTWGCVNHRFLTTRWWQVNGSSYGFPIIGANDTTAFQLHRRKSHGINGFEMQTHASTDSIPIRFHEIRTSVWREFHDAMNVGILWSSIETLTKQINQSVLHDVCKDHGSKF